MIPHAATARFREEDLLHGYLARFPAERARAPPFAEFLARNPPAQRTSRHNFDGHITAAGLVLSTARSELLLVRHKSLGRRLQPGGHVEPHDPSILAAAYREVTEETGIAAADLALLSDQRVPFDLDSHFVPPNPRKNEPAHTHHDLRYLFVHRGPDHAVRGEDGGALQWLPLDRVAREEGFTLIAEKIRRALPPNPAPPPA